MMSQAISYLNATDDPTALNLAQETLHDELIRIAWRRLRPRTIDLTQRGDIIMDRILDRA